MNFAYLFWPPRRASEVAAYGAEAPVSSPYFGVLHDRSNDPNTPGRSARLPSDSSAAARSGSEPAHRWFAELKAAVLGQSPNLCESGGLTAISSEEFVEEVSNPAGLMISIVRAGTSPAFSCCVHFPARLGDIPTGGEYGVKIESRFLPL